MSQLSQPLPIVIGSSSGIGLSLSKIFVNNHRLCFGLSRSLSPLENSDLYFHSQYDITSGDLSTLDRLIDHFFLHCSPDISSGLTFIFMAGTNNVKPFPQYSSTEILDLFELNVFSQIKLVQFFLRKFEFSSRCNFIFASSIWSALSASHRALYGSTKASLESLVRHLTVEYMESSNFFYALRLGFVDTPLTRRTLSNPVIQSRISRLGNLKFIPPDDIYQTIKLLESTTSLRGSTIDLSNGASFL